MATLVTVRLTVGIPSPAVLYKVLGYGGAFSGGTKCNPVVTIDLDKAGAGSMAFPTPAWSTTHGYKEEDAVAVAGKPDWFRNLRAGAAVQASRALERTVDNLNAKFVAVDGGTHGVQFTVVGANPLLLVAPAIDADITVGLRRQGGVLQFRVVGGHDGFPNYTLQVNDKTVHAWDCVARNQTPFALSPPMDQSVDISWRPL